MFNEIHHIAIICSDYEKSKDFYVKKIGLEIIKETYREERDSYKLDLRVGNTSQIELFSFPNRPARMTNPEACGLRHLAFAVDDIEAVVEKLHGLGVAAEPIRIDEVTDKKFTFFKDPDDLPIELYER
jgi:glyoxylase I family protein